MIDPDIRVVVVGLRRWEEELRRFLQQSGGAERLSADMKTAMEGLDRDLRRLERALSSESS